MKINSVGTGNVNNKNNKNNNQHKTASTPSFKGHKLLEVFDVPHYEGLKGFIYELTNKQKVIIIPKKGPGATSVNTVVKTGALNEQDKFRGMSHFMEHLAFDGSKGPDSKLKPGGFDKVAGSKGASINAHTSTNLTAYFFQVNGAKAKDYEDLIAAHSTMIKYPMPTSAQYKKEQEVVIKEINQSKDKPQGKQYYDMLKNLFGIKSESEHIVLGSEENIRNITRKDVLEYHKNAYTPDNMETYIVGDVSPNKMIKLIDKYFDTKDFRPSTVPKRFEAMTPLSETKVEFMASPKVKLSGVRLGFAGPENTDSKDGLAMEALLKILTMDKSSRLNKSLSELNTGASTMIAPVANNPKSPQIIFMATDVEPGSEQKALDAFSQSFKDLKTNPISEEELDTAKRLMLNNYNRASETSENLTSMMEDAINIGGINTYKNHVADIKNITIEDLNRVADKYLNTKKAAVSILQPEEAQNKNITFTGKALISPKFIKKAILKNNVNLLINDNPNTIRTAMSFTIASEAEKKPGVSNILARMLNNSTALHTEEEFANLKSKNAIDFGVSSAGRGINVQVNSLKESLSTGMDFIKEAIFSPKLDEKNFLKAKDEISMALKSAPLSANDRLFEAVYPNLPAGETKRVLRQEIEKVTLEDVQKYYDDLTNNAYVKAVVTGPISKVEGLAETIETKMSSLGKEFKAGSRPLLNAEGIKKPQVVVQAQKGLSQSHVVQLFHVDSTKIEDVAAFKVLNTILGSGLSSRLFKDLREKQELCYQVGSSFADYGKFASESFIIKTDIKKGAEFTDNIEKALNGFEKHANLLKKTLVKPSELENAKKSIKTDASMMMESADEQNSAISGRIEVGGANYWNKIMTAVDKVTPEDIRRVAQEHLSKPSVISILTTEEAALKTQKFLETKGEYKFFADEKS
jgi:zinc protease